MKSLSTKSELAAFNTQTERQSFKDLKSKPGMAMNYLTDTTNQLTEVFAHYFCMRMKFRSTVLREGSDKSETNSFATSCDTKSEAVLTH